MFEHFRTPFFSFFPERIFDVFRFFFGFPFFTQILLFFATMFSRFVDFTVFSIVFSVAFRRTIFRATLFCCQFGLRHEFPRAPGKAILWVRINVAGPKQHFLSTKTNTLFKNNSKQFEQFRNKPRNMLQFSDFRRPFSSFSNFFTYFLFVFFVPTFFRLFFEHISSICSNNFFDMCFRSPLFSFAFYAHFSFFAHALNPIK